MLIFKIYFKKRKGLSVSILETEETGNQIHKQS